MGPRSPRWPTESSSAKYGASPYGYTPYSTNQSSSKYFDASPPRSPGLVTDSDEDEVTSLGFLQHLVEDAARGVTAMGPRPCDFYRLSHPKTVPLLQKKKPIKSVKPSPALSSPTLTKSILRAPVTWRREDMTLLVHLHHDRLARCMCRVRAPKGNKHDKCFFVEVPVTHDTLMEEVKTAVDKHLRQTSLKGFPVELVTKDRKTGQFRKIQLTDTMRRWYNKDHRARHPFLRDRKTTAKKILYTKKSKAAKAKQDKKTGKFTAKKKPAVPT